MSLRPLQVSNFKFLPQKKNYGLEKYFNFSQNVNFISFRGPYLTLSDASKTLIKKISFEFLQKGLSTILNFQNKIHVN